jgi:uncharacterized protein (TIGR00255 family)
MTGFGSAEGPVAGGRLRFEVRSVNHRHLNVQLKLPGQLLAFESEIRERLRTLFERGAVTIWAGWAEAPPQAAGVEVDAERAKAIVKELRAVGKKLRIKGDVDLATLARMPDVVRASSRETEIEASEVLAVLDQAAKGMVEMRAREGQVLALDLLTRLTMLANHASLIAMRAPARLAAEQERLKRNVQELAGGVSLDPARLAQEVAHLADRLDITEELVRFASHLSAMRGALENGKSAVGKQLGFLLQELGRETNTMGAKANDAEIAQVVIAMKGELERMREQTENLE